MHKPDFTIRVYREIIESLLDAGYIFLPLCGWDTAGDAPAVCLRHDVDRNPEMSLVTALIERNYGITGTYYFRADHGQFDGKYIEAISNAGHETGYHYEDLSSVAGLSAYTAHFRSGGKEPQKVNEVADRHYKMLLESALNSFILNLQNIRKIAPVSTICMHGSPLSRIDSRNIWQYHNYADYGIEKEPYFDIVMNDTLYLTDTGRRWDGQSVSVRDRLMATADFSEWKRMPLAGSLMNPLPETRFFQGKYNFHSSFEIMSAALNGNLPAKIMFTFHPQRWTNNPLRWFGELILQGGKNRVKHLLAGSSK